MIRILTFLSLAMWTGGALAHGYGAGNIIIAHPHSFPTPKTAMTAAGYVIVMNNGKTDDRLIQVRSPFQEASLHETVIENDIARMIKADGFEIPAHEKLFLQPGGKHIMFFGLNGDGLEVGESFKVTLVFEHAGEVEVEFWVEERGAASSETGHNH